jgi:hypothetical protein
MPLGDGTGPLGLGPGVGGRGLGPCRYFYGYGYTPWYYRPVSWFRPFFNAFAPWMWGGYGWRFRRGWGWRGGWWW